MRHRVDLYQSGYHHDDFWLRFWLGVSQFTPVLEFVKVALAINIFLSGFTRVLFASHMWKLWCCWFCRDQTLLIISASMVSCDKSLSMTVSISGEMNTICLLEMYLESWVFMAQGEMRVERSFCIAISWDRWNLILFELNWIAGAGVVLKLSMP